MFLKSLYVLNVFDGFAVNVFLVSTAKFFDEVALNVS